MKMTRLVRLLLVSVSILALGIASPILATNDPKVVGDDCSGQANTVGQPVNTGNSGETVTNAVDFGTSIAGAPNVVSGPASLNNPGVSTGAQSQTIVGADCDPRVP